MVAAAIANELDPIFMVGVINEKTGYQKALYVGNENNAVVVFQKQREYCEQVLGFVTGNKNDTFVQYGYLLGNNMNVVFQISITRLEGEEHRKWYNKLKQKAMKENKPFTGVVDTGLTQTDMLYSPDNPIKNGQ